jgi:hypothetical protein
MILEIPAKKTPDFFTLINHETVAFFDEGKKGQKSSL